MLLTIKDVLDLTQIPRSTLYLLMQRGEFPRGFIVGRQARWDQKTVDQWVESKKTECEAGR